MSSMRIDSTAVFIFSIHFPCFSDLTLLVCVFPMLRVEDELVVECALDGKQERNRPKREVTGGERMHIQYLFHMRHGKRLECFSS